MLSETKHLVFKAPKEEILRGIYFFGGLRTGSEPTEALRMTAHVMLNWFQHLFLDSETSSE